MSVDTNQYFGQATPTTAQGDWNSMRFAIQQQILKMQTSSVVKVLSVKAGGVGPVGFVTVQVLVDQLTGDQKTLPGATIENVPYIRYQGGDKAVIIDPDPGDIGMACMASRDISSVKAARKASQPGSLRAYDFSDAMYVGGLLNKAPTHYIHFTDGGMVVHTPGDVNIQAGGSASVTAGASASITAPSISLGAGGSTLREMVDSRMVALFNSHTHGGGPTPNQTMGSNQLTSVTKAS